MAIIIIMVNFEIRLEGMGVEPQANATRCLAAGHRGRQGHRRGTDYRGGIAASDEAMRGSHAWLSYLTILIVLSYLDIFNLNPCYKGIALLRCSLHPCIHPNRHEVN